VSPGPLTLPRAAGRSSITPSSGGKAIAEPGKMLAEFQNTQFALGEMVTGGGGHLQLIAGEAESESAPQRSMRRQVTGPPPTIASERAPLPASASAG
jgi:hypothetical protein